MSDPGAGSPAPAPAPAPAPPAASATTTGPSPLRSALKGDDDATRTPPGSCTLKAVQIAEPVAEPQLDDEPACLKQFRAGPTRRLSGKAAPCTSSRSSLNDGSPAVHAADEAAHPAHQQHHQHHANSQYYSEKLLAQVGEWLEREKTKAASRKLKPRRHKSKSPPTAERASASQPLPARQRADSIDSQSSDVSLEKLENILEDSMLRLGLSSMPKYTPKVSRPRRRATSRASLQRAASSDTDYVDGDAIVPDCDVWLDNSKTLSYTGGAASTDDLADKADKERECWLSFKNEIIRIAHTLRLKGWRRVPLGGGDTITVERLSGALTNAVYVVTPPSDMPELDGKKGPPKVLLRVYGPQVEHLIDRENELKVLQRLARKKIGPRLLGTFKNGRFEQFFNAITLQRMDLRDAETSRQIAKRMRELHEGIDLLPTEREIGSTTLKSWDQWQDNVTKIITFLDQQFENQTGSERMDSVVHAWKANGYVCGVPWPFFRDTVLKYRAHLKAAYKDEKTIKDRLVFAHNDTQYGNILRIRPDDEKSPLLQAANKHKQLIVIDFEYAGANTPGLEFANHFTEWTYNYHDAATSHACNHIMYPTVEEQKRFIKAYVDHRPQFPNASLTPRIRPADSTSSAPAATGPVSTPPLVPTTSSSSIIDFMLDARAPPGGWSAAERECEEQTEKKVKELMEETRLWRPANSAFWIAWGIVQADVPGLDANNDPVSAEAALAAEEAIAADEFDYLSYAQDRALFFWGDVLQMGLVKEDELPESLRARLKLVPR
ncbi:choline kinase [Purpureocillium lilacinum]|uniref:Choline kinase n=1 Tax=Purpureocillium lilacinum TaxID=33203 RepID=A0A179H4H2_PURLI|nr:choline kinase [Purpureocillium lilacinum]OAQ85094.1 choline kinase [Purpureocillium lilacinum]OAQ89639.1 choline kinase [Purpureocillium lilacinum]